MNLGRMKGSTKKGRRGCIVWDGAQMMHTKTGRFYGVLRDPDIQRNAYVHRYSYELNVGRIPIGKAVVHTCGNTLCVNPKHLELVSRSEISRRAAAARRQRMLDEGTVIICSVCGKKSPKTHPQKGCCGERCASVKRSRKYYERKKAERPA